MAAGELTATGNPITDSKILEGISRTKENGIAAPADTIPPLTPGGCHGDHKEPATTNGVLLSGEGVTAAVRISEQEESGASSPSDEEDSSDGEDESSSEPEEDLSDDNILRNAGVDTDIMASLAAQPPAGGVAPLGLLSEFVACCVRDEYRAALILCKKVLDYEPANETAKEFLPVIQERLQLDKELPTESSSDYDSAEEDGAGNSPADDSHSNPAAKENQKGPDASASQHRHNCS